MGRLVVVMLALALALPGSALAQACKAPPGTAAVDEYCETIPAAGGDEGANDPDRPAADVPAGTVAELAETKDGQALDRLLGHDPNKPAGGGRRPAPRPAAAGEAVPKAPSNNPLNAVRSAIGAGPTLGGGFVAVLLAVVLLMLGWGWVSYRRQSDE